MKVRPSWEEILNAIVLIALFVGLIIYATHLEGKVAALEARVADLEYSYNVGLMKLDQKVTRLLKAAGVF